MSSPGLVAGAAAFGWLWGSFLNTLIDRTRRRSGGALTRWLSPARSLCLACGVPIPWHDNVPVLSYLLLRGRCRACGAAIGRRTLAVEAATPLLFAALASGSAPRLAWPWGLWGAGALSVAIVAIPTLLEGRSPGRIAGLATAVALAGVALAALG